MSRYVWERRENCARRTGNPRDAVLPIGGVRLQPAAADLQLAPRARVGRPTARRRRRRSAASAASRRGWRDGGDGGGMGDRSGRLGRGHGRARGFSGALRASRAPPASARRWSRRALGQPSDGAAPGDCPPPRDRGRGPSFWPTWRRLNAAVRPSSWRSDLRMGVLPGDARTAGAAARASTSGASRISAAVCAPLLLNAAAHRPLRNAFSSVATREIRGVFGRRRSAIGAMLGVAAGRGGARAEAARRSRRSGAAQALRGGRRALPSMVGPRLQSGRASRGLGCR